MESRGSLRVALFGVYLSVTCRQLKGRELSTSKVEFCLRLTTNRSISQQTLFEFLFLLLSIIIISGEITPSFAADPVY